MGAVTADQGFPFPVDSDPPDDPAQTQALALAVEPKVVRVYPDNTTRDLKITSPTAGMFCWLQTPGQVSFYDGDGWYNAPRFRIVANQAARLALGGLLAGDVVFEVGSRVYMWDGLEWRGLWGPIAGTAVCPPIFGVTNSEVSIVRLDVADYGCPLVVSYTCRILANKTVSSDLFFIQVRNGTGLSSPATGGALLSQMPIEPGITGLVRETSGNSGQVFGAFSLQMNLVRTGGTGGASVNAGAGQVAISVSPSWGP
jgi:hypothetical protein